MILFILELDDLILLKESKAFKSLENITKSLNKLSLYSKIILILSF